WICPVGAIQDLASRLGGKSGKGSNPLWFKYPILLMLLIISILGYGAKIAEFSPWRALLNLPDINSGFFILAGVFLASIFLSRFFCRYLCPLGAAQALVGSMSILSLKHSKNCTRCGSCLRDCPVGIRLSAGSETISPECIRCMKCVENCAADKENDIRLKIGNKSVSLTAYAVIMPILFAVLWLGLPQVWSGSQSSGDIVLGSLKDGTYLGEAKGFAGKIITEVYVTEGRISDIKVIKHQESKGWYEEVYMTLPREIISKQRLNVDAISGATKTSKGFIESVEDAIKKAQ
ncbi:MAG TPA: 4Fe-4S binding protein, partial [Sedimentibacter sp.]|nr:4Fe-4S binding protein [Sedimentibacter sp.]